jgi:hypothetical protein
MMNKIHHTNRINKRDHYYTINILVNNIFIKRMRIQSFRRCMSNIKPRIVLVLDYSRVSHNKARQNFNKNYKHKNKGFMEFND